MKVLFCVFNNLEPHSGISKKILSQYKAFKEIGAETFLTYLSKTSNAENCRMIDNSVLKNYGRGFVAKLRKIFDFNELISFAKGEHIDLVYLRCDFNASPFTVRLVRKLRENGAKVVMEIPTYPYDSEIPASDFFNFSKLLIDKIFRRKMSKYLNYIVTFSDAVSIFGAPTISISNGVDFSLIPLRSRVSDLSDSISMISVSEVHFWHGIDRVLTGMYNYYKERNLDKCNGVMQFPDIVFHIVGRGFGKEYGELQELASKLQLSDKVIFHGNLSGAELDALFDIADFGIGSLGRHRSGITKIKTLKNREYAARGIPFIYSEEDSDFDNMKYIIKASADDNPIDIKLIVSFCRNLNMSPLQIRETVEHSLSWQVQMKKVINIIDHDKTI